MIIRNIVLLVVKYDHIWRMQWHPTPVLLPGKSHGLRSLVGCSPWGRWELDMTEQLHFHFSLSCFGEGNDNLLQCSCLENSRDWGAWWAAIYGVAQSRTRLKRPRRSSSSMIIYMHRFSPVQSLSCVQLFATPWITARQASLSIKEIQPLTAYIKQKLPSDDLYCTLTFRSLD